MVASSAFVLAALTMTGVYMKSRDAQSKDDGYTIDFAALENNTEEKYQEIAQNVGEQQEIIEDDLDYMPLEAGSALVEIPGLTDNSGQGILNAETDSLETPEAGIEVQNDIEKEIQETENLSEQEKITPQTLQFSEADGLLRPVNGETIIPYSMDSSTYFATLEQYKYNPAVMLGAAEGDSVNACAAGKVVSIFENEEIGHAITMDLGNGYEITYGQLKDICVTVNSYVSAGEKIASVAAPTKYYSVEGSNLYLQLTKDGEAVNPESLF